MCMASEPVTSTQLWIVLARCHRALSALVERSIADLGLGVSDFMLLEALLHKGPLTIGEVQGKVLLASGSMTAAVDRAENRGWVIRKGTPEDRRAKVLELTPEGRRVIKAAFRQHFKDLENAISVLGEAERVRIYEPLKKLGQFAAEKAKEGKGRL